jgi:hypothetical protein
MWVFYVAIVLIGIQLSHQIHPISKIAVGTPIKVYDVSSTSWTRFMFSSWTLWYQLIKKQGDRNESIKTLASFMRDMLASLSEVKDLAKIEMLRSVINIAVTRVDVCAKFIESCALRGFWGEFAHCLAVTCLIENRCRPPRSPVTVQPHCGHNSAIPKRFRRTEAEIQ